jgi:hypothetical protein
MMHNELGIFHLVDPRESYFETFFQLFPVVLSFIVSSLVEIPYDDLLMTPYLFQILLFS